MNDMTYYVISGLLTLLVLIGIAMMSRVKTAVRGNLLSAFAMAAAIVLTLYRYEILTAYDLWIVMALTYVVGMYAAYKVKMIEMPQTVALLNGFGGGASALVAVVLLLSGQELDFFSALTGGLAVAVGTLVLIGSCVAGGKLHNLLSQRPVIWNAHQAITVTSAALTCLTILWIPFSGSALPAAILACVILSGFFGYAFSIRVGGADMPITISLLNSLSGVAGSIAGMAISDPLLVAVGGVVGASGLLLTQIMCRAMNRSLGDILLGKTSAAAKPAAPTAAQAPAAAQTAAAQAPAPPAKPDPAKLLSEAKSVIIIPGYGMALAQAQALVKELADKLEARGALVRYAIHPVAGRMPGHMNVLLAEVDVPYEQLYEMDTINSAFADCDVALVIGANDVVNPAANSAEGTPIYGMPVLSVEDARNIIICNYDKKPGYAGVDNPLYEEGRSCMMLGDAKDTLQALIGGIGGDAPRAAASESADTPQSVAADALSTAKSVIIIPGYGMALAQAQTLVKRLADKLEARGVSVKYAIHPVAGRMPGHMNVLLAEVDVPYEQLYEMDTINSAFAGCDVALIVGANDVVNPAANTAEGTPIYGMPVLSVEDAKQIIICNYDLKPGYAGVDNPLYTDGKSCLMLGDAKDTVQVLIDRLA